MHRDQGDLALTADFVIVVHLNAKCCAAFAKSLHPSAQAQTSARRDGGPMLDANHAPDHDFREVVDMALHLADANRFSHGHQVPGCQTLDQSLRIRASMR